MAFGDIGGPVTELIITCKTVAAGEVAITRGDAVKLVGPYEIDNDLTDGDRIFGQALADCNRNAAAISIRVHGICDFPFTGTAPTVDGEMGVVGATGVGVVQAGAGVGLIVKVNNTDGTLEALL